MGGRHDTWRRLCNVFEFRGDLICRMHIYLDPDYGGEDKDRFLWGEGGRKWYAARQRWTPP